MLVAVIPPTVLITFHLENVSGLAGGEYGRKPLHLLLNSASHDNP